MRPYVALVALAIGCGGHGGSSSVDAHGTGDALGTDGANGDGSLGGGTQVHLTLNNRPGNAAMFSFIVAYQDGSGPWQLAGAPSGDTYTFTVNSPSYAVAWTCNALTTGTGGGTSVRQVNEAAFAISERTSLTFDVPDRCTDRAPMKTTLSGTVANRGGGAYAVNFGTVAALVGAQGYRVNTVPGTKDVVLRHFTNTGGSTTDVLVDETLLDRGVAVTAPTTDALDASTAVATQGFPVDVTPPVNGRAQTTTMLYTAGGTTATLVRVGQNYTTASLDPTQMMTGDVYDQQILVAGNGQTAIVTNATAMPDAQTYTAPDPLGGATSTVPTTTPYPEIQTTWAPYASTIGYQWVAAQQPTLQQCGANTTCTIAWSALLSPGVTGNSPGFKMPDLSALTGWDPAIAFVTGTQVTGYAEADTSSAGASDFPSVTPPTDGTQRVFVRSDFTVTP
jgi:hypothetical protein